MLDDHPVFMEGAAALIDDFPGMKVVLKVTSIPVLLHKLENRAIDLLLLDLSLQPPERGHLRVDGDVVLPVLAEKHPDIKVIVYSQHNNASLKAHLIEQGACAYLCKTSGPEALETTLRQVNEKGSYFSQDVSVAMRNCMKQRGKALRLSENPASLNENELECLCNWMKGLTISKTGEAMHKSPATVKVYRVAIRKKTDFDEPSDIFRWARENGIGSEE